MNDANPANSTEKLYEEYVAAKVIYKASKIKCKNIPDDNPQKAEIIRKLQNMKDRMAIIDKLFQKHIDSYADLLDSELSHSLGENDIILLREELEEVRKSIVDIHQA